MFGKVTKFHGSGLIEAEIIASELPATMPTTSDGIDNLGSGYTLAPGSTMIVAETDKQYILGTDGTWEEFSTGGGDVSGKADKVSGAVSGNFAGLDGGGNLTDSGKKAADFEFSNTATGTSLTLTDATDGYLQGITIKGHSEVVSGAIKSVGDARWGVVDLGTLTWSITSNNKYFWATINDLPSENAQYGYDGYCSNLNIHVGSNQNVPPHSITICNLAFTQTSKRVYATNDGYSDATAFKSAMPGVMLYYPLADASSASPLLGIVSRNGIDKGTAATITTALPLRSTFDGTVYDELINDSVTTRCEVLNDTVVAKATPVITPLTSAEKSAIATLKTYPITTHVEATDSPNMTVDYLLDTDNGKAASAIDQKIIVIDVPEMHRMIFRGKNLGSSVSADQLAAIRDGSFRDLFVGDYWETTVTINATIDGTEVSNTFVEKWRIADINYWLGCGDTAFTSPHLVIVPDIILYSAKMNDSTTTGGYVGSKMYTTNLAPAKTAINAAFPNIVLTHREYLINAVTDDEPSGGAWYDSTVELMNENMVYGHSEYAVGYDTNSKTQLALFQIAPQYIVKGQKQWLRTIASSSKFVFLRDTGVMNKILGTYSQGVRTVFAIG